METATIAYGSFLLGAAVWAFLSVLLGTSFAKRRVQLVDGGVMAIFGLLLLAVIR